MARAAGKKTAAAQDATARGTVAVLRRYLARKGAAEGADVVPSRASDMPAASTPERALTLAVGRAAQKSCAMPVYPSRTYIETASLAELSERLPERALIMIVEDAQGLLGIVALCPEFLTAIIEMQSIGRVTRTPPRERRPTRTDASISAEFVNAMLAELSAETKGQGVEVTAYRFASFVDDPKPLELMLEDLAYRSMRVDLRLGHGGVRDASLLLFLPGGETDARRGRDEVGAGISRHAPHVQQSLASAVRRAPISLHVVLCRRRISLRELRALQPGAELNLPAGAMGAVRLETGASQLLAQGKLGAFHGMRALRIGGMAGGNRFHASGEDAETARTGLRDDDRQATDTYRDNIFTTGAALAGGDDDDTVAMLPLGDADAPDPFRETGDDPEEDENMLIAN
ncbi:FliM/FliN family flagellar motor switch protein [Paracoccus aurantiacus]|uniref:FliM/FliN family flagellar motor switch protein n=1 Tax=Paracoccus aurantiacus TaxID=2599412 RepID=A0A5C6S4I5_9RHOB|nr:flagellar motor switch protein FliM [Paracoccus aurantiacus]TXB69313.1 FliM/FliN family flagellar motor switch protein [Paracoccus aurantiacus]